MSDTLKQWLKLRSKNQRLYDSIIGAIKKQVRLTNPEPAIVIRGDKQLGQNLFIFEIMLTIDMQEELVDAENNGWSVKHEVISIDFLKFDIINENSATILTEVQKTLLKKSVDIYLRNAYTI